MITGTRVMSTETKSLEVRVTDIKADKTLNRRGRRMAIKQEKCAGTTARKKRRADAHEEQKVQIASRVARQVEQAKARKAAIEKSKNPSKYTLIKRRIFAMREEQKRLSRERYARKMERKNHAQ